MIAFSHAKINLGLFVMNKQPDGFHALESVFWPVDWTDVLEVHTKPSPGLELKITGLEVPGTLEGNLIAKAYELMAREFNIGGVTAHLHKSHPNGSWSGRWQLQCNVHDSLARSAFFTESNRTRRPCNWRLNSGRTARFFGSQPPPLSREGANTSHRFPGSSQKAGTTCT